MAQKKEKPAAVNSPNLSTEAVALAEIVDWSKDCPAWQRDALRRLCSQDQLDAEDLDDLTELCKDGAAAVPLGLEHVRSAIAASVAVTLKSLHSVKHVNALAAGEKLTFDKIGVTVLYGDNGSGKSGYARILKRACRARSPRSETVLPNIYGTAIGQPSATIEFTVNGENRSTNWLLNQPADTVLSAVSVFDSRTANVHVDQTNDVAYTPVPLQILASLAQVCQDVKQRLTAEVKKFEQQTPAVISKPSCQPGTKVGKLMASLSAGKPEDVTALALLSESEKVRLATLRSDLAADPLRAGRHLQALKGKLDTAISRIEQILAATSDANLSLVCSTFTALSAARSAAQTASVKLFSQEALPEIGSNVWRALWEAARKYSETSAYPEKTFPVTDDGARCVLCLQELPPETATRLNRFEAFVKDESKRREGIAQKTYDDVLTTLDAARIGDGERNDMISLIENELGDAALATETATGLASAGTRLLYPGKAR